MTRFIQLHLLTSYPPANLNRDDLGRPKTAVMGGKTRLRVSSQSLKRAWRTSEVFQEALAGHLGTRTKEMGKVVFDRLIEAGVSEKKALKWAQQVAGVFGKLKKDSVEIEQLAHFAPVERAAIDELTETLAQEKREPTEEELLLLKKGHRAADISLFGRMLASSTDFNVDAAAQVAHAVTVHAALVEDDFFTAVDDLNTREDDMGAGHLGETEFGAGLFYLYLCIDRDLLERNLSGDAELTGTTLRALVEAATTVAPTGKQNSFASRAYASYVLAEKGRRQPRSLAAAFLRAVEGEDFLAEAISQLEATRERFESAYDESVAASYTLDVGAGKGDLAGLLDFVAEAGEVDG